MENLKNNNLKKVPEKPSKGLCHDNRDYFFQDNHDYDIKKYNPHYSNVLNWELGLNRNKNKEKLLPSVPYYNYKGNIKTESHRID